jgi:hypothetical protein
MDRKLITHMIGAYGGFEEPLELAEPVKAEGNIEDWLKKLEMAMQHTIKEIMRNASRDVT